MKCFGGMEKKAKKMVLGVWKLITLAIWWSIGRRGVAIFFRARLGFEI